MVDGGLGLRRRGAELRLINGHSGDMIHETGQQVAMLVMSDTELRKSCRMIGRQRNSRSTGNDLGFFLLRYGCTQMYPKSDWARGMKKN